MDTSATWVVRTLTLLLAVSFALSASRFANREQPQDQKILERLLTTYDERVRPPSPHPPVTYPPTPNASAVASPRPAQGPVLVKVNILIRMLSKIDVVNMEYSMQITFREQWLDKRLAYAHLNFTNAPNFLTVPHVKSSIWMPDSFFPNEKSAHRHLIDTENMFLRIHSDGTILYSARLTLVCSCPMHLQLYPLDVQHCDFDLVSYAHTTRDIIYEWDASVPKPVQLKDGVGTDLPNFKLVGIDTGVECASYTNTGAYACLRMRMRLSRLMTYFVLQLYFPTTMSALVERAISNPPQANIASSSVVIVSWVSFWIDMHSTAGRVALAMTTLLTITTITGSINAKLPPVNYVKVIDVWLGTCQLFVFGALIEYAVVCYKDNVLRAEKSKRREAALRRAYPPPNASSASQAMLASRLDWRKDSTPLFFELSTAPSMSEKRQMYSPTAGNADDEYNAPPCTCERGENRGGGIASYLAASLGIGSGADPTLSTLVPISSMADAGNGQTHRHASKSAYAFYDQLHEEQPSSPKSATTGKRKLARETRYPVGINLKFNFAIPSRKAMWNFLRRKLRKPQYMPAAIDYYARIYMPLGFLIFNLFYWGISLYLAAEQTSFK